MTTESTDHRLSRPVVLRIAGASLVLLALVVILLSVVTGAAGWPFWPVLVVAAVGLGALAAATGWLWRGYVVRLDAVGYRVRMVRGTGVSRARWVDVAQASTAEVQGIACVVLGLRDGRTTTVPVALLDVDRDEFVGEVRERLRNAR